MNVEQQLYRHTDIYVLLITTVVRYLVSAVYVPVNS